MILPSLGIIFSLIAVIFSDNKRERIAWATAVMWACACLMSEVQP